jgi:hypothetical protein
MAMTTADDIVAAYPAPVMNGGAGNGGEAGVVGNAAESLATGEQPAILANLSLATEIANQNLAQQNAIAAQQAMFQLQLATAAKCAEMILAIDPTDPDAPAKLEMYGNMIDMFMAKFGGKA